MSSSLALFVERIIFSLFNYFYNFVKYQLDMFCVSNSVFSVLFQWSIYVSLFWPIKHNLAYCSYREGFTIGYWVVWLFFKTILVIVLSARVAIANHHRLGTLNNGHLFITVQEAGKYKIILQVWSGSRDSLLSANNFFLTASSHSGERECTDVSSSS